MQERVGITKREGRNGDRKEVGSLRGKAEKGGNGELLLRGREIREKGCGGRLKRREVKEGGTESAMGGERGQRRSESLKEGKRGK